MKIYLLFLFFQMFFRFFILFSSESGKAGGKGRRGRECCFFRKAVLCYPAEAEGRTSQGGKGRKTEGKEESFWIWMKAIF